MVRVLLVIFTFLVFTGCTATKWTVVDEEAVNENQAPRIVSETMILDAEQMPTVDNPVLRLVPYTVTESEYDQRIKVERAVQQYRPKWGFSLISLSGAAFALTAAHTDAISVNNTQRLALNITAGVLAVLAVTNLRESGDPIFTGETQYLRRTGFETRRDTVIIIPEDDDLTAHVEVFHNGTSIFSEEELAFSGNVIDLNLGSFAEQLNGEFNPDANIEIFASIRGNETRFNIAAADFLEPYFIITEDIVQLRNQPAVNAQNVIAEIGEGSSLRLLEDLSEQWVQVLYGSTEAYVSREFGHKEWRSPAGAGSSVLFELAEIPFGEIDVENSLPVLKPRNSNDRAITLFNQPGNQAGVRQYAERDVRLFRHYMTTAFRMASGQIIEVNGTQSDRWLNRIEGCGGMESGSLKVFISGFATIGSGQNDIELYHLDQDGNEHLLSLSGVMDAISQCGQEKTFVFVDLEYLDASAGSRPVRMGTLQAGVQQNVANVLLREQPNSIVIFGNKPGQASSMYSGAIEDDKRHHIFPYFLAEALQQRRTSMSNLVRHLESNVDYTSRRLHDRPQEINVFGNLTLNITN